MENYVRIYATNINKKSTNYTKRGRGEREKENRREKQKQKFKTTMKNVLGGHVMGKKKLQQKNHTTAMDLYAAISI